VSLKTRVQHARLVATLIGFGRRWFPPFPGALVADATYICLGIRSTLVKGRSLHSFSTALVVVSLAPAILVAAAKVGAQTRMMMSATPFLRVVC
jgi:hypothetical protein